MHKVEGSSAIAGLEMKGEDLRVHFVSGKVYDYAGVGQETMVEMINSNSAGKFFSENIRNNFDGVEAPDDAMEVITDDAVRRE